MPVDPEALDPERVDAQHVRPEFGAGRGALHGQSREPQPRDRDVVPRVPRRERAGRRLDHPVVAQPVEGQLLHGHAPAAPVHGDAEQADAAARGVDALGGAIGERGFRAEQRAQPSHRRRLVRRDRRRRCRRGRAARRRCGSRCRGGVWRGGRREFVGRLRRRLRPGGARRRRRGEFVGNGRRGVSGGGRRLHLGRGGAAQEKRRKRRASEPSHTCFPCCVIVGAAALSWHSPAAASAHGTLARTRPAAHLFRP